VEIGIGRQVLTLRVIRFYPAVQCSNTGEHFERMIAEILLVIEGILPVPVKRLLRRIFERVDEVPLQRENIENGCISYPFPVADIEVKLGPERKMVKKI